MMEYVLAMILQKYFQATIVIVEGGNCIMKLQWLVNAIIIMDGLEQ